MSEDKYPPWLKYTIGYCISLVPTTLSILYGIVLTMPSMAYLGMAWFLVGTAILIVLHSAR